MPFSTYSPSQSCLLGLLVASKLHGCNWPSDNNFNKLLTGEMSIIFEIYILFMVK